MKSKLYKKLYSLYFDLNPTLLKSLEDHTRSESGNIYTLEELLRVYADKCSNIKAELKYITELYNNNSISCMEEYYIYIENMLFILSQ